MTYEQELDRIDEYTNGILDSVELTLGVIAEDLQSLHCRRNSYNLVVTKSEWYSITLCPKDEDYDEYYHIRLDYSLNSGELQVRLGMNDSNIEDYIKNNKYYSVLKFASEQYNKKKQEKDTIKKHIAEEARIVRALQNSVKCTYL